MLVLQGHITGLPSEVASTPFGQQMLAQLTPVLQERFSHATAAGFAPDTVPAASSIAAAASSARAGAAPSAVTASASNASATLPAEGTTARQAFQSAIEDEFAKVKAEGVTDVNQAGAEAVKRVMLAVREGRVLPPPSVPAAAFQRA